MKRLIVGLMVLSVPLSIFLSVHQVYRYQNLESKVETLKEQQSDVFERNKRMIANIAIVRSPERIENLAKKKLDLSRLDPERKLRIIIDEGKGEDRSDG